MKIDLFNVGNSQYKALDYFTERLAEALERKGVEANIQPLNTGDPAGVINRVINDRPDVTLAFNGLLPDPKGRFLCDMINIPHIAWTVDSPAWFLPLKESPLSWATCIDRSYLDFFHGVGYDRTAFITQACDIKLFDREPEEKVFDVTMLASCIDIEDIEETWEKEASPEMQRALNHAVDISLRDPKVSFWQAFSEAIGIHRADQDVDFEIIIRRLRELELYVTGKERLDFLKHMTSIPIDVFGDRPEGKSWSYYLKGMEHIKIHPPVTYDEHLDVIAKSRITLNNIAKMREGGSERAFHAFALNTLSMSTEGAYMREFYKDEESILFNRWGSWQKDQEKLKKALSDDAYRTRLIEAGREITRKHHTWDNRAEELIPFVKKITHTR
ncbi:MAG: glycosyltransferase family 1 protein [Chlamydiia bacterium]|nr:glycosyltransferase family 1 protein [Chlamydiia bacterium]